jgi:pSer/pThr/pTyr-binding forkhead associated (FHA) protein
MATSSTQIQPGNVVLEYNSHVIVLPQGEVLLGRSVGCFLQVDDPGVSRVHLRLLVADKVVVEDIGSTNGTLVNGALLQGSQELAHGDVITVGSRTYRVKLNDASSDFEPDAQTPVTIDRRGDKSSGTMQGLGAVSAAALEQRCPACGHTPVIFNAESCPGCGVAWPKGRPEKRTDRHPAAVAKVRRHHRYSVQIRARYASEDLEAAGVVSNLSISGVFIATIEVDPLGTPCKVTLVPERGDSIVLDGFVRHVIHRGVKGRAGMGIEFSGLNRTATRWITVRLESSWQAGGTGEPSDPGERA